MPQRLSAFRLPEEIIDGLQHIKERDGIPISEQVRRALAAWVKRKRGIRVRRSSTPARRPSAIDRT
jgi:hypothetical protein